MLKQGKFVRAHSVTARLGANPQGRARGQLQLDKYVRKEKTNKDRNFRVRMLDNKSSVNQRGS